ncbi:MAG: CBS domain-containing protein [Pirellulaceae bacterium]|nr:MAG: CBS domain-containing protein [Pirellulaceae bacterium]
MSISTIATRSVDLADRSESVWRAAERMHHRVIGCLLVVDEEKRPIGILTDRDIVERVVSLTRDPLTTPVQEVMSSPVITIHQDAEWHEAVQLMKEHAVRRLAVVGDQGELVGVLSLDDVLMYLAEQMAAIGKLIARQTPPALAEI